jgi:hypothetical protein
VHGVKGASYGICAEAVGRQAQVLESAAQSGDFETVHGKNGVFIETVEKLLSDLQNLLRRVIGNLDSENFDSENFDSENFEKETKNAPDKALLAKLSDAAGHFDFAAMDAALKELERYRYESDGDLVTWLRKQVDRLEYSEIQKRLKEMPMPLEDRQEITK